MSSEYCREAFQRAFPADDGVQLIIKTQNTEQLSRSDERLCAEIRRAAKQDFIYEEAGQEWAEPDVEHAAQRMLEVRTDPKRPAKIQRAFERIDELYDENAVGETYRERVDAIRAGLRAGELVANAGPFVTTSALLVARRGGA